MTKQNPAPAFVPGANCYRRDDGILMVEVKPGLHVNVARAREQGVAPLSHGFENEEGDHAPTQGS